MKAFVPTVLLIAGALWVSDSGAVGSATAPTGTDALYCQDLLVTWRVISATDDGFTVADDLPSELAGETFDTSLVYVAEWFLDETYQFVNPLGIWVRVWSESCPPGAVDQLAAQSYVPWTAVTVLSTFKHLENDWVVKKIVFEHDSITIADGMSIGFHLDIGWEYGSPFVGVVRTPQVQSGCGMYYIWEPYDPEWTLVETLDDPSDLVFCLGNGGVATETKTWSEVKALYR
jgi:hypothetical protein